MTHLIVLIIVLICGVGFVTYKRKPKDQATEFRGACNDLGRKILTYPVTMSLKDNADFKEKILGIENKYKGKVSDEGVLKTGIDKLYNILSNRKRRDLKAV